jgi:hypothetical protein
MKYAETALMQAVRTVLRMPADQRGAAYKSGECEIEHDEMAPATVGDRYTAIMPGGVRTGPRHNTSGGVHDLIYGVDVLVIARIGNVPRDRLRDVMGGTEYAGNVAALNEEFDKILSTIDFDFTSLVNRTANEIISKKTGSAQGFIESLKFTGADKRPRVAAAELFGGNGNQAGLVRAMSFHGARRITTRS